MKIGILTFHWATNYGAILQAYCLQEWLCEQGHNVIIINYKPRQFGSPCQRIFHNPKLLLHISSLLAENKKEQMLLPFREERLRMTRRYYKCVDMAKDASRFDVLISGSDQVLNAYFTTRGEEGLPSSAYYLAFTDNNVRKIGYALSFGCTDYPMTAVSLGKMWINGFDVIGIREQTGTDILKGLGYKGHTQVVPDPTILYGRRLFEQLGVTIPLAKERYTCVYMLRRRIVLNDNACYIDEHHYPLTMEQWLSTIIKAEKMVTNSYHGMIMALLSHVPFVILLEQGVECGMNDRFSTLLSRLGLENRMVTETKDIEKAMLNHIDFAKVDALLSEYQNLGQKFLTDNLR